MMMDFARYTHLNVPFGRVLNQGVLCPHYHQLHQSASPQHPDWNFGLMLTVWVRLFGTLAKPDHDETFKFGLPNRKAEQYQSLRGLYSLFLRKVTSYFLGSRFQAGAARAHRVPTPDSSGDA